SPDQRDPRSAPVEIAVEVEDVRLDGDRSPAEHGPGADPGRGGTPSLAEVEPPGIDARRRDAAPRVDPQVGGGDAEPGAPARAMFHRTVEHVRTPEHGDRIRQATGGDRRANPSRRHRQSAAPGWRDGGHPE